MRNTGPWGRRVLRGLWGVGWIAAGALLRLGAEEPPAPPPPTAPHPSGLPFLAEEAHKRGIELPLPLGVGFTYYYLDRAIEVTDLRVGRDGAPPATVSQFAQLASSSSVHNLNVKVDAWILPFLNVYAIVGGIQNRSDTTLDLTLPSVRPGGPDRSLRVTVPTSMDGSVAGLGLTLAGGYGPFFMVGDLNVAQADLGFDDRFRAVVGSVRAGWNGKAGGRPLRLWASATEWQTYATVKGSVADPEGGTLAFEVDQGPAYSRTYGVGASYAARRWLELSLDAGTDFHGGWYIAVVPVYRF